MAAMSSSMSSVSSTSSGPTSSTPATATSRQWRVPGPSTRYHKSEHKRPKPSPRNSHTRNLSSLSTHSSYTESSQSPLARLSFGPFMPRNGPYTPNKSPRNSHLRLQGSPFSDYFTDDNHSVDQDQDQDAPYDMPSDHAHKLLLRLNNLGSDILRLELPSETLQDLSQKLDSLETTVNESPNYHLDSSISEDQSSAQDSAVASFSASDKSQFYGSWVHDTCVYAHAETQTTHEHDIDLNHPDHLDSWPRDACAYVETATQTAHIDQETPAYADSTTQTAQELRSLVYSESATQTAQDQDTSQSDAWVTDFNYIDVATQTTHDRLLADLQDVVQRLAKANESLRRRHDQSKQLNDSQALQLEELTRDIMSLKSENDSLKSDLGFDHSELLFLKLQLQAIEVQTDNHDRSNTVLLADDFDKWKADWDHVDARLRSRREKNRVPSASPPEMAALGDEAHSKSDDQGNWQLKTRKKRHGRVQSITINRVEDSEAGAQEDDETLVEHRLDVSLPTVKPAYLEQSTQTEDSPPDAREAETIVPSEQTKQLCSSCGQDCDEDDEFSSDDEMPSRTPWQELCDGLVAFAGMQRD